MKNLKFLIIINASVYRRQIRAAENDAAPFPVPVMEQHDYIAGLKKYLDTPPVITLPEQVVSCSARCSAAASLQTLCHTWRAITGVASMSDLLFADVQEMIREAHQEHVPDLPIYLSEWNTSPSQQDLLNDTCFKACYIVKSILENYDRIAGFGYWSLTDWMGEAPLPKELFFGGLCLFTVNGLPKASYYAFTLLRRLGDTLIGRGDGWFATRQGESYRVLLYNYRHFSHLYAQGEQFDMTFTDRYTPFSPEQSMDVHLFLTDVENGDYIVRETVINRQHGSAFDQWLSMGALELDRPEEYASLASGSLPAYSKYLAAARRHVLELDAMLDMLEVRLLVIDRV